MATRPTRTSNADRIYAAVREMAISFALKPGERIVEGALAERLGASRTPLREALNRLVAEDFVVFRPGAGFYCREIDAREIFDLYELRLILEVAAAELACMRAGQGEIEKVVAAQRVGAVGHESGTALELAAEDEAFHEAVAALSGNRELVDRLQNINRRIRFVRWIDAEAHLATTRGEHGALLDALVKRDAGACREILKRHIARRRDQVGEAIRASLSRIYLPEKERGEPAARVGGVR